MRKIGFLQLGLTFAGCFLGAGYVSGQEMWQFFGRFGKSGFLGLIFAIGILCLVGAIMLMLTQMTGILDTDRLLAEGNHPVLRTFITLFEFAFLFSVSVIMTAGVGALGEELFSIPPWLGCLVFTIVITICAFTGLRGMVTAFSATVPILVLAAIAFGVNTLIRGDINMASVSLGSSSNQLLRFWPLAALSFACFNMFCSVAIIAPLGISLKSRSTIFGGITLGAVLLLAVALSILLTVSSAGTGGTELPMLSAALEISHTLGMIYGVLLFFAMFGTCLSNTIAFLRVVGRKSTYAANHRTLLHIVCGAAVFACSLFGFGDLIGTLYPIFGYCSSVFIVMLVVRFCKLRRQKATIK